MSPRMCIVYERILLPSTRPSLQNRMNLNVGQVHAKPIALQHLTQQLVDASTIAAPAIYIRTTATLPNLFLAPHSYVEKPGSALGAAFAQLGGALVQQLFPGHQAVVNGLCLAFDHLGQIGELVESGAFALDDAIELGRLALDGGRWHEPPLTVHPTATLLTQVQAGVGFIVKVRSAYFAGPVIDPILPPRTYLPDQEMVAQLTQLWLYLAGDQFHTALANRV